MNFIFDLQTGDPDPVSEMSNYDSEKEEIVEVLDFEKGFDWYVK